MKLLFDQNISPRILKKLPEQFFGSNHVRFATLQDKSDLDIFRHAKNNGFAIVTFDADFVDLNLVYGIPPKIIWLRTGNMTTSNIAVILNFNANLIQSFLESTEIEILEVMN